VILDVCIKGLFSFLTFKSSFHEDFLFKEGARGWCEMNPLGVGGALFDVVNPDEINPISDGLITAGFPLPLILQII